MPKEPAWLSLKLTESCRHLAAAEGCYSVVLWLLSDMKCNPNPVDRFDRTPLEVNKPSSRQHPWLLTNAAFTGRHLSVKV